MQLHQFESKHILKCQPTYLVPGKRNARFSENAMFGLDFVLECEMGQMLNPPRVLPGLKENAQKKKKCLVNSDMAAFHHVSLLFLFIVMAII